MCTVNRCTRKAKRQEKSSHKSSAGGDWVIQKTRETESEAN